MRKNMAQWASVVVALGSLLYCGYKDYGEFWKYLNISDTHYPIEFYEQVYKIAYDPNSQKTYYLYLNGQWYDKPPQVREHNDQSQKALAIANGPISHGRGADTTTPSPNATAHGQIVYVKL